MECVSNSLIWNMVLLSGDLIWNSFKLFNLEIPISVDPFKYQIHCYIFYITYKIYNNNDNYNNN